MRQERTPVQTPSRSAPRSTPFVHTPVANELTFLCPRQVGTSPEKEEKKNIRWDFERTGRYV